jgi:preprotein translocase subunit SecG
MPVASIRRGGFAGNLTRVILVALVAALALSMMFGWGMSAFADEPSGSAQEATTENVSVSNTDGADNAGASADTSTADSNASAKEARNDLLLPTIIAIAGFAVLCIALVLLIMVWRRGRKNRNK